jgi:hypothetical protein
MNYENAITSISTEGFQWERFREYFPFGDVALREGNYLRLVSHALASLPDTTQRALVLSLLDAQAAAFLEQVWVQNEQLQKIGKMEPFTIEGHFASAWLQINDNLRYEHGLAPRNVRGAMLKLQPPETLADRMVQSKP